MRTIFTLLLLAGAVFACSSRVDVTGRVRAHGRGVFPATVRANELFSTRTNQFGFYRLTVPNCGVYRFSATAKGFAFEPVDLILPVPDADFVHINFTAINRWQR